MSDVVICVENLSKSYLVGHQSPEREHYSLLREVIAREARNFARKTADLVRGRPIVQGDEVEEFWALQGVSFQVERGEVFGIIGGNGAGKSTLLKILSRITDPTRGRATLKGRVASLLEVGTGFHPELTGRENIFLNGAVLGMTKAEIRSKFEEIVVFAEVEQFLDTPVKRYSSGMYVRLAFSVAAHLEPEILILDEVLAVGDAAFQKKCLRKMDGVAKQGRTVLFVSHNTAAVLSLCSKALLLKSGTVQAIGKTQDVIKKYAEITQSSSLAPLADRKDRTGDGAARVTSIQIETREPDGIIRSTSGLKITISYKSAAPLRNPNFLVGIYDSSDAGIFMLNSEASPGLQVLPPTGTIICMTAPINLTPGSCYVNVALMQHGKLADHVEHASQFLVEEDVDLTAKVPSRDWVLCLLKHKWSILNESGS